MAHLVVCARCGVSNAGPRRKLKRASPANPTASRTRATVDDDDDDDDDNSDADEAGAVVEDEQTKRQRELLRYEQGAPTRNRIIGLRGVSRSSSVWRAGDVVNARWVSGSFHVLDRLLLFY